jgi:hypothetical protein
MENMERTQSEKVAIPRKNISLELSRDFFEHPNHHAVGQAGSQTLNTFVLKSVGVPDTGGVFLHYHGTKFPKAGFPFSEAIFAIDLVKKYTMSVVMTVAQRDAWLPLLAFAVLPWKMKMRILENALNRYINFSNSVLNRVYLKPRYTTVCTRELRSLLAHFCSNLGIHQGESFAKIFSTLIEYDDAYRYRVQDLFGVVTKDELLVSPVKAVEKMAAALKDREEQIPEKFDAFIKIARVMLHIPRVRKAFKKAVELCTLENLQMSEGDIYHSMLREGYNYGGLTIEERVDKWVELHGGMDNLPEVINITT